MTIKHIEFEDLGQDFLWWEVDMETGRVVGCGPFQGSVWADGRHTVDLAALAVGHKLHYWSPTWADAGALLKYRVIRIDNAEPSKPWALQGFAE
jgi:hypothetical protein